MKKRINKLKSGWRNRTPIDENQLSVVLDPFFSAQVFLIPACGSEHQEQASWMEKEVIPPEVNFGIVNQSKNKEIQKFKSNDRMKIWVQCSIDLPIQAGGLEFIQKTQNSK